MLIKNVQIYTEDKTFKPGALCIRDGVITGVYPEGEEGKAIETEGTSGEEVLDGAGAYLIPGLIDMHMHGCRGCDFSDGTFASLQTITEYESSRGITAISPASMTLPVDRMKKNLKNAADFRAAQEQNPSTAADLVGINMEGPFVNSVRRGAQEKAYIRPCDIDLAREFLSDGGGLVKVLGVAPECNDNALEFIRSLKGEVILSLSHTNADYDTAMAAIKAGVTHVTHLHNVMPPFLHREPGVVGAVVDSPQVNAELICDGVHNHPSMIRATFKMLGADRIILISDSMQATGLGDGQYAIGDQPVTVKDGRATLTSTGNLAGSAADLMTDMVRLVKDMGIPLTTAVSCATINPARELGIDKDYGSIAPGKKGDVVLLDENLKIRQVIKDGKRAE